jgi:hypothetical protein
MEHNEFALDYFAGGVPAYQIFAMHLGSILGLLRAPIISTDHTVEELAFIGIVSYTEAFFKDHFASIMNVFPHKISLLKERGRDVCIDPTDLLVLEDPLHTKFGFLLSERFNFGTPKAINAIYHDLVLITPFSKETAAAFDRVIATRNLLVHHGGMFTSQFNKSIPPAYRERTFVDSVVVTKVLVSEAALLVNEVASSTVQATTSKLSIELKDAESSDVRRKALVLMGYDPEESVALTAAFRAISVTKPSAPSPDNLSETPL